MIGISRIPGSPAASSDSLVLLGQHAMVRTRRQAEIEAEAAESIDNELSETESLDTNGGREQQLLDEGDNDVGVETTRDVIAQDALNVTRDVLYQVEKELAQQEATTATIPYQELAQQEETTATIPNILKNRKKRPSGRSR